MHLRGVVRVEGDTFSIRLAELPKKGERELAAMMARVHDGSTLNLRIHEPIRDALHRSLLAWSFLGGQNALATCIRRRRAPPACGPFSSKLTQCLPPTLILRLGTAPLSLPLPRPEAVVVVASEVDTVTAPSEIFAVFGLGMRWGQVVVVLPFANDPRTAGSTSVWRNSTPEDEWPFAALPVDTG